MGRIGLIGLFLLAVPLFAQDTAVTVEAEITVEAVMTPTPVPALEAQAPTETPTALPPTDSMTPPASLTATPSASPSPTSTITVTLTPKPAKKGKKGKETDTPTETATSTLTETVTATTTSTATETPTPTVTATSTPGVFEFSVGPKPLKGKATVRWSLTMPVDRVTFKVYTSSFRLVRSRTYLKKLNPAQTVPGPVETEWDVTDDRGNPLTPGTYFFYLTAKIGKQSWEARDQAVVP